MRSLYPPADTRPGLPKSRESRAGGVLARSEQDRYDRNVKVRQEWCHDVPPDRGNFSG